MSDSHDCKVCPCSTPGTTHCPCLHAGRAARGCGWVECDRADPHEHPEEFRWVNPGDPTAGEVRVLVDGKGQVTISEAALAQLLVDAGWERAS